MALACRQFSNRASPWSIQSTIPKFGISNFPIPATSSSLHRFSLFRPLGTLGCIQSLLPFHSVVAVVRLMSSLSTTSRSCRALSQAYSHRF